MDRIRLSIIMTCHNRKACTCGCIGQLIKAADFYPVDCSFFVCDDGSTDGTADVIRDIPGVHIIKGTGDLFWARGMAAAMTEAEKHEADFYLMVNDDVVFYDHALKVMLDSFYAVGGGMHAVVGATVDAKTGERTYGGHWWNGKALKKEICTPVLPQTPCGECNQANWNCFLIPKALYDAIGRIDTYYEHGWADYDYSNRIVAAGYKIYVASDYIGTCSANSIEGTWRDTSLPLWTRLKAKEKKTGVPARSYWYYCRKYYGKYALPMFLATYASIVKTSILKKTGRCPFSRYDVGMKQEESTKHEGCT